MLKLESKKVSVEYNGHVLELEKFTVGQLRKMEKVKAAGEAAFTDFLFECLVESGFPRDELDSMPIDLLKTLVEALGVKEKKD